MNNLFRPWRIHICAAAILRHLKTSPFLPGYHKLGQCQVYLTKRRDVLAPLSTVKVLCIGTDRSQQTVQTKIRLLLKKQSDQGLRCLPLHQLLLDALMQCYIKLYQF